jgi:superfamily II DNA or RNA helicase
MAATTAMTTANKTTANGTTASGTGGGGALARWTYRPHQQQFIDNEVLYVNSPGRLIDHELGSGKTLSVIGAIEALRQHYPAYKEARVLVLTMKALINGFHGELDKSLHFQATRKDLYTVTTVQRFYNNPGDFAHVLECGSGSVLVIDEAHTLRNPKSKRYRVVFQAAKKVLKTYLMSGTVAVNYSVDVAPLFNLILSDCARVKYLYARRELTKALERSKRSGLPIDLRKLDAGYLPVTRGDWEKVFESESFDSIKTYMQCLVSHHEEDHDSVEYKSHFPTVRRFHVKLAMTDEHYARYKEIARDGEPEKKRMTQHKRRLDADFAFSAQDIREFQAMIRRGARLEDLKNIKFLAWVQRLRIACNYVKGKSSQDDDDAAEEGAESTKPTKSTKPTNPTKPTTASKGKTDDGVEYLPKIAHAVLQIVEQCRADPHYKATLTTTFIGKGIRLAQRLLRLAGVAYVSITGQVEDVKNEHDIQRHVRAFNSGAVRVMLFSSAGQHGLDLHGAYDAFILNPHWNKRFNDQAEARVIRYDSHKNCPRKSVNVYYYTMVFPPHRSAADVAFLPRTADEFLMELGQTKEDENKRLRDLLPLHCVEMADPAALVRLMCFFKRRTTAAVPRPLSGEVRARSVEVAEMLPSSKRSKRVLV